MPRAAPYSKRAIAACAIAMCAASVVACSQSRPDRCASLGSSAAALVASGSQLSGMSLGDKQLAFTFDDGPGDRTSELSGYLKAQGIAAVFFINGKNVPGRQAVLAQIVADGHLLANHTQNHSDLPALVSTAGGPAKVLSELTATDAIIAPYVPSQRFMFRAPYGDWNATVFDALKNTPMAKYVGPIKWDIGGVASFPARVADYGCWQNTPLRTTTQCGDVYLRDINTVRRGVVLMHDPYGGPAGSTAAPGNTVDMVRYGVPKLKLAGYTFIRLDRVPEIAALLPPESEAQDAGPDGDADGPPVPAPAPPESGPAVTTGLAGANPSFAGSSHEPSLSNQDSSPVPTCESAD